MEKFYLLLYQLMGFNLILIKFDQIQLKLNDNFMYMFLILRWAHKFVYKQFFDVLKLSFIF